MARGRVQVADLAAPDPIRPAPLQSDTFAAPAQPMIDNDADRLTAALGHFGASVSARLNDPAAKAKLLEQHTAEWNAYTAVRTNNQVIEAVKAGTALSFQDPPSAMMRQKWYGDKLGEKLADDMEADIRDGKVADIGTDAFDPDAYTVQRSRDMASSLRNEPHALNQFMANVDHVKKAVTNRHQTALGEANSARFDQIASDTMEGPLDAALADPSVTPEAAMQGIRQLYPALGPRARGGSLDMKLAHLDAINLELFEKKARDPRYAEKVVQMMGADRKTEDGHSIGPMSGVVRLKDKVASIVTTAKGTLATAHKAKREGEIIQGAAAAILRGDGSLPANAQDIDETNPYDSTKSTTMSGSAIGKKASQLVIQAVRAQSGGQENPAAELDLLIKSGMKHEQFFQELEQGYVGGLNTNTSLKGGPDPQQLQRIMKAGDRYNQLADQNHTYAQHHLTKPAHDFFETYSTLVRFAGQEPAQAAANVARIYSQEAEEPHVAAGRQAEISAKVSGLDYSWLPGGGVAARGDVERRLVKMATALAKSDGMDQDTAIKAAAARIQSEAIYINGRAVMAPGINKGDEPHVQTILDDVFARNKAYFEKNGISDASYLSVAARRSGVFDVVRWDGGAVTVPVWDDDPKIPTIIRVDTIQITPAKIRKVESEATSKKKAEDDAKLVSDNDTKRVREERLLSPQSVEKGISSGAKTMKGIFDSLGIVGTKAREALQKGMTGDGK